MNKLGTVEGKLQRDWIAEIEEVQELIEILREELKSIRARVSKLEVKSDDEYDDEYDD